MRGKLWLGAAAAALMAFGFAPASAQDADPPGDASTQAQLAGDIEGELSPAGDSDWYRLRVEQGQRYNLALVGIENAEGQAVDPMIAIYDGQGNQVAFNDDAGGTLNSALRYSPSQSGEVFVEARAFSDQDTGSYRLGISSEALPPDDAGADASTRARASIGRTVNGNIEYEGDIDWLRFSARTGNRYRVTLEGADGEGALGDPVLRVLDRDGNELAVNDDSNGSLNSELEFIPRGNGDVFIEARGYGDAYAGRYALNVTAERLPRDATGNTRSTIGRIRIGQTVNAALDYPSDSDWYRVRLEDGQSYHFTLNTADGDSALGDPMLRLYDASGTEIGVDDDGGDGLNSYLEHTATRTGDYFIEARGFVDDATGAYVLTAHAGDVPAGVETDAGLSPDGDYREGMLAPAGDRDWYRLDLSEGQGVRIGMHTAAGAADALGDPFLVIYGPDGQEVARDDDGGDGLDAWLEYQATAAGTYFVEARGFVEDAAGRYTIAIIGGEVGATPDGAEAIQANGDTRVGAIGNAGDADWFVLEMIEGRPYRINLEGAGEGALADPLITLYDSTGAEVASDDDGGSGLNAYLNFASPAGGPYFIGVSSFDDTDAGRYQLRVSDTDVPGNAYTDEVLDANDDSRLSRIELPGDQDYYRVTLESGRSYQIEANGAGAQPLADPFVAVLNEENTRVTSDDDTGPGLDARVRFRPPSTGAYLIQVTGLSNSTGTYEVKIVRR